MIPTLIKLRVIDKEGKTPTTKMKRSTLLKFNHYLSAALAVTLMTNAGLSMAAEMPSQEEMWRIIQQQQREIEALKNQQATTKEQVEATGEVIDEMQADDSATQHSQTASLSKHGLFGHGKSGSTTIGGYGELHYNNLDNSLPGGTDNKKIELHRAILFVGHEFNDRLRFWSELEIERAQAGDKLAGGEVSMEQAFLEYDLTNSLSSRAGLLLMPVGILNETHEPSTFYGVERNPVETNIIPTTWREGGIGLNGHSSSGLSYDLAIHSGLKTDAGTNFAVRKGRTFARDAPANNFAYTGRIKWTGLPGLELAATLQYQSDITQSIDATAGSAILAEAHAIWNRGPFGLRALYATWKLDGPGPAAIGADRQTGWYVEPSFKITSELGLFARYNRWDNQAGNAIDSRYAQLDLGLNYWLHPDVVLKADYQNQAGPSGKAKFDGFNLGIGYQF